jgi:hypothetical protein
MFSACRNNIVDAGPEAFGGPVSYAADIAPLFGRSCDGFLCHVGEATSGVDVSDYSALMASVGDQYGSRIIIPGDPNGSPIIEKLLPLPDHGVRMPLGATRLTDEEISKLVRWIGDGAENN